MYKQPHPRSGCPEAGSCSTRPRCGREHAPELRQPSLSKQLCAITVPPEAGLLLHQDGVDLVAQRRHTPEATDDMDTETMASQLRDGGGGGHQRRNQIRMLRKLGQQQGLLRQLRREPVAGEALGLQGQACDDAPLQPRDPTRQNRGGHDVAALVGAQVGEASGGDPVHEVHSQGLPGASLYQEAQDRMRLRVDGVLEGAGRELFGDERGFLCRQLEQDVAEHGLPRLRPRHLRDGASATRRERASGGCGGQGDGDILQLRRSGRLRGSLPQRAGPVRRAAAGVPSRNAAGCRRRFRRGSRRRLG
mmetsp:Transcript_59937/g.173584  ORF Transcript_59937/g.173584 Transcript_59937/m.173584 type:complete len:305 (+) Transcript_59937:274-1188(+)